MKRAILLGSLAVILGLASSSASADTIFTLTQNGCSGGCGAGPFGTITLSQTGANVNVTLALASANNERFAGTGAGDALEFNVLNAVTGDITNISSGFALGPSPDSASTFGSFLFSVECTTCQGGQSGNSHGPLSFTVQNALISDFVANAGGYYFASDIAVTLDKSTNTGNVAAIGPGTTPPSVPEPSTLMLFGTGVTALGGLIRRRFAA
ncbi:PEP-CTERM sorting domain-containing protein [Edaphobacter aggregans]|uniref:PEP-CTERM sorting domain-containing protein n=1 Tax=Edaphobacter aggregans TaxID=570835 RepID=UPI000554240A|nr:PEP-CTERM sorting domain-containing protein [Edaphobacter aggregans]